ncbi:MAG: hypothetical protein O6927_05645 [Gammaproteobacteria bacterium]|nr:hypothetical protein [Gammaproteobacteria bacterium]
MSYFEWVQNQANQQWDTANSLVRKPDSGARNQQRN